MEKPRVLSGEALVAKGITKIDASLPEVGLKDVAPNGSWLEQKQIQAALEARKHLIEVERIEKCGNLSHAKWHDDLMLAEVTQKSGGHWQYLGHNVGKTLYLQPEEALFLMEVNCLLLKHNEVTVSLQKAYSLLLRSSTTMIQYKVYASLSRLGYKVFRHKDPKTNDENKSKALHEHEIITLPAVNTQNKTENADSAIVNANKPVVKASIICSWNAQNDDSTIVETETGISALENTVDDSDNLKTVTNSECVNSAVTNNVTDDTVDAGIDHSVNNEEIDTQKDTTVNAIMESGINNDKEVKSFEINENIAGISEGSGKEDITTNNDTMEVEENADNVNEFQEVSSTTTIEDENKTDSMDICTENQESEVLGSVSMDEDNNNKDMERTDAEEPDNLEHGLPMDTGGRTVEGVDVEKYDDGSTVTDAKVVSDPRMDSDNQKNESNIQSVQESPNNTHESNTDNNTATENSYRIYTENSISSKIEKLTKRQVKARKSTNLDRYFENIPDLTKEDVIAIKVPDPQFIPKNIFVHNSNYLLNLRNIKQKTNKSVSTESVSYTSSDEVNGNNIRRIRGRSSTDFPNNPTFFPNIRFARHHLRPYTFWRPQNNLNFYQFSMFVQRPSFPHMYFQSRVQYLQRPNPFLRSTSYNLSTNNANVGNNARKRTRSGRTAHLQGIKNLAVRLKQCLISGNNDMRSLESLHNLLHSYNLKYKARLRLTENFDVVNEEKIVETIELDDDEESKSKKPKVDQDDGDKFDENLYRLRQLASRLRDLETKDKATASHRRAFSKAIRTFNKSYSADIYFDEESCEVIDRRCITLDSSSESDCVVEEKPIERKCKGKKLRNPFNILKRRSERLKSLNNPGSSKDENALAPSIAEPGPIEPEEESRKYNEILLKTFNETWLPNEMDFGRAEIVPKQSMNSHLIDSKKEQFLYEFMKDDFQSYQNWIEVKISFLKYLEETSIAFHNEQARMITDSELSNTGLRPLIDIEDNLDMPSVLEKLRIIKNDKEVNIETSLRIDFDVYNRDVQNFRKRNPPKPHFRIICIDESSSFPSAADLITLHSKYDDNVPIVFAIVGIANVSYIQINPIALPIYVPNTDVV